MEASFVKGLARGFAKALDEWICDCLLVCAGICFMTRPTPHAAFVASRGHQLPRPMLCALCIALRG